MLKSTVKELVIISGKGGTGKTSICAAFAYLSSKKVMADCDVDAADLHLVMGNTVIESGDFQSGRKAFINNEICTECGQCLSYCRFNAINKNFIIDKFSCEGCGVCAYFCPEKAIDMNDNISGQWFVSDSQYGSLVHARLGIAEGNSGKLVTFIKKKAHSIADEKHISLIIVDGSPGTGCPVIATITGASFVLIVTEPTVAGIHDLKRVAELCGHFGIKYAVCINKADINQEKAAEIKTYCGEMSTPIFSEIPYDKDVTMAQIAGKSIVEYSNSHASISVQNLWKEVINAVG